MTYQEAIDSIIEMGGGIENVAEQLDAIKTELTSRGTDSDNWKNKYEKLSGEYRRRFDGLNGETDIKEEDIAEEHRISDEAEEEERKEKETDLDLKDLFIG